MAFFCKVLLLQSQKLKKGSWIAVRWGAFWTVCLSHSKGKVRRDRRTETANSKVMTISSCSLHHTSFTPANNSKVGITVWSYGMYPLFWWLTTETVYCLFLHTSSNPISLLSLQLIPLLRACDLWSKASRQQGCRLWVWSDGSKSVRVHAPSPMLLQTLLPSEMSD